MDEDLPNSSVEEGSEEPEEPMPGPSRLAKINNNNINNAFKWPCSWPHPLLIPDVLRDVLEKLDMRDVETCRKVCRGWNDEACAVLQDKKVVALLEYDALKFYLQKMEDTPYFPHTSFELHMENLNDRLMRPFWQNFGSQIKSLDLRQSVLYLEPFFEIISQRLPNLEKLALKTLPKKLSPRRNSHPPHHHPLPPPHFNHHIPLPVDNNNGGINQYRFPTIRELTLCFCPQDEALTKGILKDLLRSMPNLEKLSLNDIPACASVLGTNSGAGNRARVARLLMRVLTDASVHLPLLHNIDFQLEVGNLELEALTIKRYQFQTLSLKLNNGTKSSTLKDLLTALSPNLRNLDIVFPDSVSGFFAGGITFPAYFQMKSPEAAIHLKEITDLTLKNFHGSLGFIKNLQKVKRLTVNNAHFDACLPSAQGFNNMDNRLAVVSSANSNEHGLEILRTDSLMSSSVISSLSNCFPLLRILQVKGLDDDGLGVIYRNLPYLVELDISEGKCTDQGISGVPLEVCVDMAETVTFKCVNPEKYRRDLFLGSLQYLKVLTLSSEEVTDISIAFGIVDCKNLKKLTLHSPSVTDTGLIKIADRLSNQLMYLDVIHCENVSEAGKFYVKEKMRNITLLLEPFCAQRPKKFENPHRQVGFPYRGRLNRSSDRTIPLIDDEYDHIPMRNHRVVMAMDRRRENIHLRMVHRVGVGPAELYHHNNMLEDAAEQAQINHYPGINPRELEMLQDENFSDEDDEEDMEEMMMGEGQGHQGNNGPAAGFLLANFFGGVHNNLQEMENEDESSEDDVAPGAI